MKSKEEILKPYEKEFMQGAIIISRDDALKAMEEYSDAYSAGLVIMLAELVGQVERMRQLQKMFSGGNWAGNIIAKNEAEKRVDATLLAIRNTIEEEST